MKRLLKYAISFLVVVLLFPITSNAQTIKRPQQKTKTEKTQKQNNQSPAKKRATNEFEGLTANQIAKIGLDYEFGRHGKTQDYTKAVKWYRKAANQGNEFGQISLAKCYYYGHGVTKNLDEAKSLLLKAIAQGSNDAKTYLWKWFGE